MAQLEDSFRLKVAALMVAKERCSREDLQEKLAAITTELDALHIAIDLARGEKITLDDICKVAADLSKRDIKVVKQAMALGFSGFINPPDAFAGGLEKEARGTGTAGNQQEDEAWGRIGEYLENFNTRITS